jgi:hemerythrin
MELGWDPALATGIAKVDGQHQEIFRRAEALVLAIRRGSSREEVGATLRFLEEHVETHFRDEEALMREVGFPLLESHQREHQAFVHEVAEFISEHRRAGASPSLILRVTGRIASWLKDHIGDADRRLAEFVRTQGRG